MTNYEKYVAAFEAAFDVSPDEATTLEYQSVSNWDSVGHINLITQLEDAFGITIKAEDLLSITSFEAGKDVLANGYGIVV